MRNSKAQIDRTFHLYNIFDLHQFLLQERLTVLYANQFTVAARKLVHLILEPVDSKEDLVLFVAKADSPFQAELRGERQDGLAALLVWAVMSTTKVGRTSAKESE